MRQQAALTRVRIRHLTLGFGRALRPRPPRRAEREWLACVLTPAELTVFDGMPRVDQREGLDAARRLEDLLPASDRSDSRWLAAAVLHDAGKQVSGLHTFGRVGATIAGAGLRAERRAHWRCRGGLRGRVADYLDHAALGADFLEAAGARAPVVSWARAHHDRAAWPHLGFPEGVAQALARADGEAV